MSKDDGMEIIIDHGQAHAGQFQAVKKSSDQSYSKPYHDDPPKHDIGPLPPMQMVIQLNVYREAYGHYQYLLLRRIHQDKAFWQVITEPVPSSSTLIDTMRQAAGEQAGLYTFRHLSHEMHSYEWYAGDERGRDIVFAAEVEPDTEVRIDESRYSEFKWLAADEAIKLLKWNGNKQAIQKLEDHLRIKRLQMPATITSGFYGNGSRRTEHPVTEPESAPAVTAAPAAATMGLNPHTPFTGDVPKRLPDMPEEGIEELRPYPEEDDERTGEWFL